MGHFETYVQKTSRSVSCQFRLESSETAQLVRDNIHKLDVLLKNLDYSLDSFSFIPQDKPYTLLDSPEIFEEPPEILSIDIPHLDIKA